MISVFITHFHQSRISNLYLIADALREQVDEVVIFNQDAPLPVIPGARVIQAEKNWGCQGIFIGLQDPSVYDADYVLLHDNDVVLGKTAVGAMLEKLRSNPGAAISATGEYHDFNGERIYCTRNKLELVERATLNRIIKYWYYEENQPHNDIWYSVMAYKLGIPVIPIRVQWQNLRDTVGMWNNGGRRRPEFFAEREALFQRLMKDVNV